MHTSGGKKGSSRFRKLKICMKWRKSGGYASAYTLGMLVTICKKKIISRSLTPSCSFIRDTRSRRSQASQAHRPLRALSPRSLLDMADLADLADLPLLLLLLFPLFGLRLISRRAFRTRRIFFTHLQVNHTVERPSKTP